MHPTHIEQLKGWSKLVAIASLDQSRKSTIAARNVIIKRLMRATAINEPQKLIGIIPKLWVDQFPN